MLIELEDLEEALKQALKAARDSSSDLIDNPSASD